MSNSNNRTLATSNGYTLLNNSLPRTPRELQPTRCDGVHLSSILSYIHGWSDAVHSETDSTREHFDAHEMNDLMDLGRLFETGLKRRLCAIHSDRFDPEPTPLICDGVHCTPDMFDYFHPAFNSPAYWEIKFTLKSAKRTPGDDKFLSWEQQVMGYCYADNVDVGIIAIAHFNGDYGPNSKVEYREWGKRYSQSELLSNWEYLMYKKREGEV